VGASATVGVSKVLDRNGARRNERQETELQDEQRQ
jgi:hypothetical protein